MPWQKSHREAPGNGQADGQRTQGRSIGTSARMCRGVTRGDKSCAAFFRNAKLEQGADAARARSLEMDVQKFDMAAGTMQGHKDV
jgi:hypothetical protein